MIPVIAQIVGNLFSDVKISRRVPLHIPGRMEYILLLVESLEWSSQQYTYNFFRFTEQ